MKNNRYGEDKEEAKPEMGRKDKMKEKKDR